MNIKNQLKYIQGELEPGKRVIIRTSLDQIKNFDDNNKLVEKRKQKKLSQN